MNSKLVVLLLLLVANSYIYGQSVDYNRVIPPKYLSELSFPEKLVYLAWNNHPSNDILKSRVHIAEKNKIQANWAWLEIFSAAGNLNEFTINQGDNSNVNSQFFPRYNFGARVTMNMFVDVPTDIKIAKEEVKIASASVDNQKLALRAEVLRAYQNYLLAKEILSIETESTEEAYSTFLLNEQKFKNGEVTLELYNESLSLYNAARISKLNSESNFNLAEINLEELIGVELESVK